MDKMREYILDTIIGKHEGGYQANKKDKGNFVNGKLVGTNFGISAPALSEHIGRDATVEDMKSLTEGVATEIMYNNYYKKYKVDKLPEDMQHNVLDMVINSGSNGIKILQKSIGVKADGIIGKKTLGALSSSGFSNDDYSDERIKYYNRLAKRDPNQQVFLDGWINRANKMKSPKSVDEQESKPMKYDNIVGDVESINTAKLNVPEKNFTDVLEEKASNLDSVVKEEQFNAVAPTIQENKMDAEVEDITNQDPIVLTEEEELEESDEDFITPIIYEGEDDFATDEVNVSMSSSDTEDTANTGWVSDTTTTGLGGREEDITGVLDAAANLTLDGMGKDFGNKIMDANSIGMLMQAASNYVIPDKKIDPDFDPRDDKMTYEQLTKDLDNEQLDELLGKHSYNREAFFTAAISYQEKNKRQVEMESYAQNHPVLSAANLVGSLLVEGAIFMPVSTAIGASGAAIAGKSIGQLSNASRLGLFAAGELVEQGMQEVIWSANSKDYHFDPLLFGFGVLAGSGMRNIAHNTTANKHLRDLWNNQGGFVNLSAEEGDRLIKTVTKNTDEAKAVALATRLVERKAKVSKDIITDTANDIQRLTKELDLNKVEFKSAEKGSSSYKQLKSQRQKLQRKLRKIKKDLPNIESMIADGTHPRLKAELTPELSVKSIAKSLDIPANVVDDPMKLRRFLGIDNLPTDVDFVVEGEKNWHRVSGNQLKEMKNNKRLNANQNMKKLSKVIGDNEVGNRLHDLANTDGVVSKYVFNKGSLVDSENPLVGSFYNWLAPDGMGREGASSIRAIQSQEKYSKIYGGQLLNDFHAYGDELYEHIKNLQGAGTLKGRALSTLNVDDYEDTVMEIFKQRLNLGKKGFADSMDDPQVIKIANEYADSYNELNGKIIARMKEVGVEGVDFDSTEDFMHRSWDYTKARGVNQTDLEQGVLDGMKKHLQKSTKNLEIDEAELMKEAKKFTYGIRNADITKVEEANKSYIKYLTKLAKKADGEGKKVLEEEITRLTVNKAKSEAGDLANRVGLDVNSIIPNDGRALSELLEDNFIVTQKRYNTRMSARIAAAEHGIKDINELDDWIDEALELEVKRLADAGVENPRGQIGHVRDSLESDLKSFKNGHMAGIGGQLDAEATDLVRFANKYNFARLMQHVGFSSIAEVNGTIAEAGVNTVFKQYTRGIVDHLKDIYLKRPTKYTSELYDEMRTITGIGFEDYSFSTRGTSKSTRIFKKGIAGQIEKGVDVLSRTTQGTFGGIETINRRLAANSLAINWGKHFKGNDKADGIMSIFTGSRGTSNRVLENAGLGAYDSPARDAKFITNDKYDAIKKNFLKNSSFDDSGNLKKLNLDKWDSEVANSFGDVVAMQASHILVDPDSTTQALWQTTTIGRILNQYRTFSINANTKVFGYAAANAAQGLKRGDLDEVIKFQSKLFWATMLGTMAIGIRENVKTIGDGQGLDTSLFDEGVIKAAAIGFSRSSMTGGWDAIIDGVGGGFGYDPIFDKTSSYGRSRNFFNLMSTPMGQAVGGIASAGKNAAQGNFKKAGLGLWKVTPMYRQFGLQQIFNYTQRED